MKYKCEKEIAFDFSLELTELYNLYCLSYQSSIEKVSNPNHLYKIL